MEVPMDNIEKSYKEIVVKIIDDIKNTQKTIFAGANDWNHNKDLLHIVGKRTSLLARCLVVPMS